MAGPGDAMRMVAGVVRGDGCLETAGARTRKGVLDRMGVLAGAVATVLGSTACLGLVGIVFSSASTLGTGFLGLLRRGGRGDLDGVAGIAFAGVVFEALRNGVNTAV